MSNIESLDQLRAYYNSGATKTYPFRMEQLKKLKTAILNHEQEIYAALDKDLKKSPEESWVTEVGVVISELNLAIKNLSGWMRPEPVPTNLVNLPSSSRIMREPLGVVLIIGPWNYPFQLLINPVVGAIAAGNCIVLKPSESAQATERIIQKIIQATFPPNYIMVVEGDGSLVIPAMMNQFTFDHVFYTGSTAVGRIIYKMDADKLTPVTLELGGKSPCVVEKDANIHVAARRIAVTKFSNPGQMCVAPDYVLVHESVREEFLNSIKKATAQFYGENPEVNYNYGRIINQAHFDRISTYLKQGTIIYGGKTDKTKLYIEPTLITDIHPGASIMKEEIFGPVLPILSYNTMEEALSIIRSTPNPLSFYVYTSSAKKEKQWLEAVPAGGACVNNSSWHFTNHHLPFGGRGASGTGNYHGRFSFETFSHRKAVLKTPSWFDPAIKYPPFKGKLKLFKWVIR